MKVCFFMYGLIPGGAERTVAYLANYAVNNGHEIDIVLYSDEPVFYKMDEKVNIVRLGNHSPLATKNRNFFKKLIRYAKNYKYVSNAFKKYIDENKPDVVVSILFHSIIYTLKGCKNRVPIIASERSNPGWVKSSLLKGLRNFSFNKASGVIFQTERASQYFSKKINKKKIVIPNAVGNPIVDEVVYNENKTINKIGAVGSLREQKDYPTMIKAFSIFHKKHNDFILEVYGEGIDRKALEKQIEELGLKEYILLKGNDPQALRRIVDAKCYLMTSICEGMPNSLMEAMAIGMPCVSTDCECGPAELIENGKNGLLVPIQDPQAISDAISKMVEDRDFAIKCGNNAALLKQTNSVDIISKRYFDYFESVAKNFKKSK